MTRIFEPDTTSRKSYDRALRSRLPHDGGVPKETMLAYLGRAGFFNMQSGDLMYILELQKPQIPWYRRLTSARSYYLIAATKKGLKLSDL
jgi:hypothetical protein